MAQTFEPSTDSFIQNFDAGKTQLLWSWVPADLDTTVSAYLKLCAHEPYGFLFESIEGGAVLGRYSVIGLKPDKIWKYKNGIVTTKTNGADKWEEQQEDALSSLRRAIAQNHIDITPEDLPPMAVSGFFGYMGYDTIRLIEDIPDANVDTLKIPDSIMIRPTILAIFDNIKNMICLVTPIYDHANTTKNSAKHIYEAAKKRLINAQDTLKSNLNPQYLNTSTSRTPEAKATSNINKTQFLSMVDKAIDYIEQGEIFQVVLSQRFELDFDLHSFELYRSLRRLNPSPFMFHLSFEGFSIVGSSPEILVRVRDNTITIRPIAGTRPRGATPAEDRALADSLLADPKERAEHLMLLDLGRNDVGRAAEIGSVNVTEKFTIELYSHVMHIVSNVEGTLNKNLDFVDALFAGFPAGTVSGAPKVRAMEIIEELEPSRRSYYGGCVGYFSGNGELDSCIALRTALVKDGKLYVQAGAGIVADSNPEDEYQETVNKAQAIVRAAQNALKNSQDI